MHTDARVYAVYAAAFIIHLNTRLLLRNDIVQTLIKAYSCIYCHRFNNVIMIGTTTSKTIDNDCSVRRSRAGIRLLSDGNAIIPIEVDTEITRDIHTSGKFVMFRKRKMSKE